MPIPFMAAQAARYVLLMTVAWDLAKAPRTLRDYRRFLDEAQSAADAAHAHYPHHALLFHGHSRSSVLATDHRLDPTHPASLFFTRADVASGCELNALVAGAFSRGHAVALLRGPELPFVSGNSPRPGASAVDQAMCSPLDALGAATAHYAHSDKGTTYLLARGLRETDPLPLATVAAPSRASKLTTLGYLALGGTTAATVAMDATTPYRSAPRPDQPRATPEGPAL